MNIIKDAIRTIPDFPIQGIMFRDVTTLFSNPTALNAVIKSIIEYWEYKKITAIVGIEARGFITGSIVANHLKLPFIPIRKKGKLPFKTISQDYDLEYGKASIEIHKDALNNQDKVLILDDLIATGGTAIAGINLVKKLEAKVVGCSFIIDLPILEGTKKIQELGIEVQSLCSFDGH